MYIIVTVDQLYRAISGGMVR